MILRSLYCFSTFYDVIVIGGGHAGCQASAFAAKTGAKTLLATQSISTIGELSCNPAIGGLGKSQLVKEIDALGGLMGKVADKSILNFKILNLSKGKSVQSPRAQVSRNHYKKFMQEQLFKIPNLTIEETAIQDFEISKQQGKQVISGLICKGGKILRAKNYVLTTGTFLRGMIHLGKSQYPAGRHRRDSRQVEPPVIALAQTLKRLKFPIGRCMTGTPPRISAKSIDFSKLGYEMSDKFVPFHSLTQWSHSPDVRPIALNSIYNTKTNPKTHELVNKYRSQLPNFQQNQGKGVGPRYCPSLQRKVLKFPGMGWHIIHLQLQNCKEYPSDAVYPTGLSMAFPEQVQLEIIRTIAGFQNANLVCPGYSVEYDFISPHELSHSLRSSRLSNLFLAGQINGTTGYEEAAAQGVIAGINAGRLALERTEITIGREKAYIGVLVDDIIKHGVKEPYRIFTSRAEQRLELRVDNADRRLTPLAIKLGFLSDTQKSQFEQKVSKYNAGVKTLQSYNYSVLEWKEKVAKEVQIHIGINPARYTTVLLLSNYYQILIKHLPPYIVNLIDKRVHQTIECDLKYKKQIRQSGVEFKRLKKNANMDFSNFPYESLKFQIREQEYEILTRVRPKTLKEITEIPGLGISLALRVMYLNMKHSEKKKYD